MVDCKKIIEKKLLFFLEPLGNYVIFIVILLLGFIFANLFKNCCVSNSAKIHLSAEEEGKALLSLMVYGMLVFSFAKMDRLPSVDRPIWLVPFFSTIIIFNMLSELVFLHVSISGDSIKYWQPGAYVIFSGLFIMAIYLLYLHFKQAMKTGMRRINSSEGEFSQMLENSESSSQQIEVSLETLQEESKLFRHKPRSRLISQACCFCIIIKKVARLQRICNYIWPMLFIPLTYTYIVLVYLIPNNIDWHLHHFWLGWFLAGFCQFSLAYSRIMQSICLAIFVQGLANYGFVAM